MDRQHAPATIESKQTAPPGPFCCAATEDSVGSTAHLARLALATIGPPISHDSMKIRPAEAVHRSRHEDAEPMTAEHSGWPSFCRIARLYGAACEFRGCRPVGECRAPGLSGSMAAWAGATRPMHGLSQRYVNRINGCLDCRPHLRPSVRVPAALHGRPISDSPGVG